MKSHLMKNYLMKSFVLTFGKLMNNLFFTSAKTLLWIVAKSSISIWEFSPARRKKEAENTMFSDKYST